MNKSENILKKSFFSEVTKSVGISLIFTLLSVLCFALVIKLANLDAYIVKPINQFIKTLSIFTGCYFGLSGSKGWLKGLIVGLLVTIFTFLIFSLLSGALVFDVTTLWELLFGAIIGILSGVISVNFKKS